MSVITVIIDTPYTRLLSSLTSSKYDMIGIVYTEDSKTIVKIHDTYTGVQIEGVENLNDIYNCSSVISLTTYSIPDNINIKKYYTYDIDSAYDNLTKLLLRAASDLRSEAALKGNKIINKVSNINLNLKIKSTVLVKNKSNELSSIINTYEVLNKILFSVIPIAGQQNSNIYNIILKINSRTGNTELESLEHNEESIFVKTIPNIIKMKKCAQDINERRLDLGLNPTDFNTTINKMMTLKSSVEDISNHMRKIIEDINNRTTPTLNIEKVLLSLNTCRKIFNLKEMLFSMSNQSHNCIICTSEEKISFNTDVGNIRLPLWNANLSIINTDILKDVLKYLDNCPDFHNHGNLQEIITRELSDR